MQILLILLDKKMRQCVRDADYIFKVTDTSVKLILHIIQQDGQVVACVFILTPLQMDTASLDMDLG